MATITDLAWTDTLDSNKKPVLTDLEAAFNSIQTHINDKIADNLTALANDCFGTSYAFDNDGAKQFTVTNLYDKITAQTAYTGGDIAIATVGAWTDVDTSNAAISITPEYLAGDFKVCFEFSLKSVTSNATNQTRVRFRLTDGSTNSQPVELDQVTGVSGTTFTTPISLAYEFDSWAVAAQTVKLQYYIVTTTASTITVLANTNCPIKKQVEKI